EIDDADLRVVVRERDPPAVLGPAVDRRRTTSDGLIADPHLLRIATRGGDDPDAGLLLQGAGDRESAERDLPAVGTPCGTPGCADRRDRSRGTCDQVDDEQSGAGDVDGIREDELPAIRRQLPREVEVVEVGDQLSATVIRKQLPWR